VPLQEEWILAQDAQAFLAENRPAFLGYQFGLALGLAEKSLEEVEANLSVRSILREEWEEQVAALRTLNKISRLEKTSIELILDFSQSSHLLLPGTLSAAN